MAEKISQMKAFAGELERISKSDKSVITMTADLVGSCSLNEIEKKLPEQFINVGIAEQNMIGIAAGLAKEGFKPFCYTFAAFNSMRACEQIRTDIFYNGFNVKVVGTHCGLSTGQAGSTHFALEDIGIIRSMPDSIILIPADYIAAQKTMRLLYNTNHGAYVRLDRNPVEAVYSEEEEFKIGKAHVLRDGNDAVIFCAGVVTKEVLTAAEKMENMRGKAIAVVDLFSIKPVDAELVAQYVSRCKYAFTVEEHNISGGVYGAISECIAGMERKCPVFPIALNEIYPQGNTLERARERAGLTAEAIEERIMNILENEDQQWAGETG